MKSYDVKFWAIRPGKAKTRRTYEIRWKVGRTPHSSTLGNKAQADNFLSDLRQAARNEEAFDTDTGLPDSMITTTSRGRSWLEFCLSYVDMKWPSAAPKTRDALIDALATIIPVVVGEEAPEGMDRGTLRSALRHFALTPASRELHRPPAAAAALRWLGEGLTSGRRSRQATACPCSPRCDLCTAGWPGRQRDHNRAEAVRLRQRDQVRRRAR